MGHHQVDQYIYYRGTRWREKERDRCLLKEIITENFPNVQKETVTQAQEVQKLPLRINSRRHAHTHCNQTDRKYEKQQITYKGPP